MSVAGGEPEIDPAALHIWEWFWDVNRGRQAHEKGPLPLSAVELKAWAELSGAIVQPKEWQIIRDMDRAFLWAISKRSGDLPRGNEQEISAAAFDAVFE